MTRIPHVRRPAGTEGARLDKPLLRAARRHPERLAIRSRAGDVTFAELDRSVTRCASALAALTGPGGGVTIGVANVLHPAFAVAYYAIARSGNVAAVLNPLQPGRLLGQSLDATRPPVAFLTPGMVRGCAPARLRGVEVVALPEAGAPGGAGAGTPAELIATAPAAPPGLLPPVRPEQDACVLFTSGTTGRPKGVRLTHRNLTVNAAQTADAHGLTARTVTLNHLPLFHPMHLNAAVLAGASQVLCEEPDPVTAVRAAHRAQADRYFTLPVRLARLAADSRLPDLRAGTLRAVFSGGAPLAAADAVALSEHFGIPVLQGYGLAETSPLTHCGRPGRPKPGSVGPPVAGTECRIVDVDDRTVRPPGVPGEVQVRGPQVMPGYLDPSDGPAVDADGWFSTGDVGHVDRDGDLFLLDRTKDVFKYDNWLVAPGEIERALAGHPDVGDCAVVDHPDRRHGAVAHALVVPRTDRASERLAAAVRSVNRRLPPYQQVRRVIGIDAIPRSPNGKIERRRLRQHLRDGTLAGVYCQVEITDRGGRTR
ncbi:class I adenylate-forming enzyme family protein [Streptomyces iconiensis]|uniref:Class I adenylate-forming enzyme family protein n=1 Tax=Streptomyces iconiensis TaxID=1384038 RepID=A0ABT7A6D3_9ACTN|nr:class I adenylate-forming enzyme family protein [Streptomyces iconiensis]MDJ1136894.1 class I adenylate-forming enzyme family protein [Streptomyces iconiensis]